MMYRKLSMFLVAIALAAFVTAAANAEDKPAKNTHEGTFVMAKGDKEFVMEATGKEHTHMLSVDAKLVGLDGKDAKLSDFKKGQKIRVTTKEGDSKVATKVEALK